MVKVYYGSLQTQSSSMSSVSQSRVSGFQSLISAFSNFASSNGELNGQGYDAARAYATGIMVPYYQACILYSEGVADAANTLADDYSAKCGAEDLDEEKLRAEIESASRGCMALSASISGIRSKPKPAEGDSERIGRLESQLAAAEARIRETQEKLDNLLEFNSQSQTACNAANSYWLAVSKGLEGVSASFSGGGFAFPSDVSWVDVVAQGWADREITLANAYAAAMEKVYNGEDLTETDLTAIERYAAEYPGYVDTSVLAHVQEVRAVKAEEMRYRNLINKAEINGSLSDEEIKFIEDYKKNHPAIEVNTESVEKLVAEKEKYSSALRKLNSEEKLTEADIKTIEAYLKSHSEISLNKSEREKFEDARITVNYNKILNKAKKEGGSANYTEKDFEDIRAYYLKHPDEDVPDYLAESLNRFNTNGLATGMTVSATAADYKMLFVNGFMEVAGTVDELGKGSWSGAKFWDKMKNFNKAVKNSDYLKMVDGIDDLSKSTSAVGKVGNHLGKLGVVGSVVSGASTYLERKDKYGDEVALQDATVHTGITATSTVVGSVIGSAIPIPIVGTLFGAWAGSVVGNLLSTTYDEARHDKIEVSDYKDWWKMW